MRFWHTRMPNPAAGYDVVAVDPDTNQELVRLFFVADSPNQAQEFAIQHMGTLGLLYAGPGSFEPKRGGGGTLYAYFRQWVPPIATPVPSEEPAVTEQGPAPSEDTPRRGRGRPRKDSAESPVDYIAPKAPRAPKDPMAEQLKEFEKLAKVASQDAEAAQNYLIAEFVLSHRELMEHVALVLDPNRPVQPEFYENIRQRADNTLGPDALSTIKLYKEKLKGGRVQTVLSVAQQAADVLTAQSRDAFQEIGPGHFVWRLDESLLFGPVTSSNAYVAFYIEVDDMPIAVFGKKFLRRVARDTSQFADREVYIYYNWNLHFMQGAGGLFVTWKGGIGKLRLNSEYSRVVDKDVEVVKILLKTPYGANPIRRLRRRY